MESKKLFTAQRRAERSKFYKKGVWVRIRKIQLRKHALCEICLTTGRQTVATVCDHIDPCWDTFQEFLKGPFQSLCKQCHKHKTQDDLSKLKKKDMLRMEVWE